MSELHLELLSLWDKLDAIPEPAPSHRNRTMTAWADAISRVRKGLTVASNQALAMQQEIARLKVQAAAWVWRPVVDGGEMPPNDVPVLVVVRDVAGRHVNRLCHVSFHTVLAEWDEEDDYDADHDLYWLKAGWYSLESDGAHWPVNGTVTHWAPLPGLPEVVE